MIYVHSVSVTVGFFSSITVLKLARENSLSIAKYGNMLVEYTEANSGQCL